MLCSQQVLLGPSGPLSSSSDQLAMCFFFFWGVLELAKRPILGLLTFWEQAFREQPLSQTRTSLTPLTILLMFVTIPARSRLLLMLHLALVPRLLLLPAPLPPGAPFPRILLKLLFLNVALPLLVAGTALFSPGCRGWSLFVAMKGHCDRHLGGFLDGELPLEWLQECGVWGVRGL